MGVWIPVVTAVVCSMLGSGGLWAYVSSRSTKSTSTERILRGLAYGEIVRQGSAFIERGWVTHDEFEDFYNNLCEPYRELGGNGAAERMMNEVRGLPFKAPIKHSAILVESRRRTGNGAVDGRQAA